MLVNESRVFAVILRHNTLQNLGCLGHISSHSSHICLPTSDPLPKYSFHAFNTLQLFVVSYNHGLKPFHEKVTENILLLYEKDTFCFLWDYWSKRFHLISPTYKDWYFIAPRIKIWPYLSINLSRVKIRRQEDTVEHAIFLGVV